MVVKSCGGKYVAAANSIYILPSKKKWAYALKHESYTKFKNNVKSVPRALNQKL